MAERSRRSHEVVFIEVSIWYHKSVKEMETLFLHSCVTRCAYTVKMCNMFGWRRRLNVFFIIKEEHITTIPDSKQTKANVILINLKVEIYENHG